MIDEENQSYEVEQDEVNYNESTEDVKITDGKIIYFFCLKQLFHTLQMTEKRLNYWQC